MTILHEQIDLVERDSGLRVGTLREEGELRAETVWTTKEISDRFQLVNRDKTRTVQRTRSPRPNEHLELIVADTDTDEKLIHTVLKRADNGDIRIVSTLSEGIESEFDPHAMFLPASLAAGDSIENDFRVQSSGPRIPGGSGKGTVELRGLGMQQIETGRGIIDAFVIKSTMSFGIGPARITLEQRAWFDPSKGGPGLVAEEGADSVKVFGISVHSTSRVSRILAKQDG